MSDALVDTGASTLLLPKRIIKQLGLRHYRTRQAKGVGGKRHAHVFGRLAAD